MDWSIRWTAGGSSGKLIIVDVDNAVKYTTEVGGNIVASDSGGGRDSIAGLAAKLVAARTAVGLSQSAAAEAAKLDSGNLSRYETGVKTPTLAVMMRLAAAYSVSVADLLPSPEPAPLPPVARIVSKRK